MALELLFNLGLTVFFSICLVSAQGLPSATSGDLFPAKYWSSSILILLIFFLVLNMINIYRNTPKEDRNLSSITGIRLEKIFKARLFWGMFTALAYALLLNYGGFLLTSFIACMIFDYILGERSYVRMVIFSLITDVVLFVLFFSGMGIMLPRGIGILRTFGLAIEAFLRNLL